MLLLDDLEDADAVQLAALQPDIEQHQAGTPLLDAGQGVGAAAGGSRLETLVLQEARREGSDVRFVVDDQDFMGHRSEPG